jgi:hypothetical protein
MPVERATDGLMSALEPWTQTSVRSTPPPCKFAHSATELLEEHTGASQLFRVAQEAVTHAMERTPRPAP